MLGLGLRLLRAAVWGPRFRVRFLQRLIPDPSPRLVLINSITEIVERAGLMPWVFDFPSHGALYPFLMAHPERKIDRLTEV